MKELIVRELKGPQADIVKKLYESEGHGIEIRNFDLFFAGFIENKLAASVRFCVEQGTAMLRTMRVAKKFQGRGLGLSMLKYFESYLNENSVNNTYCLPYSHLENFYGTIGFRSVEYESVPKFLQARFLKNRADGLDLLCMKRT